MSHQRCPWAKETKPYYVEYHDTEWGIPVHDDQLHFEMLSLEGAQAGLSWDTILKKRQGYREAFKNFNPQIVAELTDDYLNSLLQNPQIVRNRLKIFSVRQNAQVFLQIQKEFDSFDSYVWRFVSGKPILNQWQEMSQVPAKTKESDALSKDLKKRGMNFVGSTIIYAYMQAIGMVNDHLMSCEYYNKKSY